MVTLMYGRKQGPQSCCSNVSSKYKIVDILLWVLVVVCLFIDLTLVFIITCFPGMCDAIIVVWIPLRWHWSGTLIIKECCLSSSCVTWCLTADTTTNCRRKQPCLCVCDFVVRLVVSPTHRLSNCGEVKVWRWKEKKNLSRVHSSCRLTHDAVSLKCL